MRFHSGPEEHPSASPPGQFSQKDESQTARQALHSSGQAAAALSGAEPRRFLGVSSQCAGADARLSVRGGKGLRVPLVREAPGWEHAGAEAERGREPRRVGLAEQTEGEPPRLTTST